MNRMYSTVARLKKLNFYTRLNKEFCSDLWWWHTFLESWNGFSLLRCLAVHPPHTTSFRLTHQVHGVVEHIYFQGKWFQFKWDSQWQPCSIMAKELLPIVLSTAMWGPQLVRHCVLYQCNNSEVVSTFIRGQQKIQ